MCFEQGGGRTFKDRVGEASCCDAWNTCVKALPSMEAFRSSTCFFFFCRDAVESGRYTAKLFLQERCRKWTLLKAKLFLRKRCRKWTLHVEKLCTLS